MTDWSPDYTKPNPWEGMTVEYAESVCQTFIPSESNPNPPGYEESEVM